MKRLLCLVALALLLILPVSADQDGETWARLYRRMPDIKQKYTIMQNIAPLDDRSLEPFLGESLDELVYGELSSYRSNKDTYDDWEALSILIIKELGDIKAQSAAITIWDVVKTAETPLLKAEGLMALGNMRATDYAADIATLLRNLNFNLREDRDAAEIEAYATVVALGKMKDDVGYKPVFYASTAWYSDRITDYAKEVLPSISDDPATQLIEIMKADPDYNIKRVALSTALKSDIADSRKATAVVTALSEGLKYAESDYNLRLELSNLRIDAITALITLGVSTPDSPELLDLAIDKGEIDEVLIAIQALGSDGSDEAADILARRLLKFNERQSAGITADNEELLIVRQLIYALGQSGNQIGILPLKEMSFAGYTPSILRKADEALARISGN